MQVNPPDRCSPAPERTNMWPAASDGRQSPPPAPAIAQLPPRRSSPLTDPSTNQRRSTALLRPGSPVQEDKGVALGKLEENKKLIDEFRSARAEKTYRNYACHLDKFADWLGEDIFRPTLHQLKKNLVDLGIPARKHPIVMKFREASGMNSPIGKKIASAVDALVLGKTKEVHPEDKKIIDSYLRPIHKVSSAQKNAHLQRRVASWLRKEAARRPEDQVPTLKQLQSRLKEEGTHARYDPHVMAFHEAVGTSDGRSAASAIDALVESSILKIHADDKVKIHADDKALIDNYLESKSIFQVTTLGQNMETAKVRAWQIGCLAKWLRQEIIHNPENPRPTLPELHKNLLRLGHGAGADEHVIAFRKELGPKSGIAKNIVSAMDDLVRESATEDLGAP